MDMSDRSNVATSVGIWVAVAVVAVAVVGVGGPLLVYKASKTERHQALNTVRDSSGYISQGLRLSKSIRILRRVKAPILAYEPNFNKEKLPDPNAARRSKASSLRVRLQKAVEVIKEEGPTDEPVYQGDTPLVLDVNSSALKSRSPTSWVRLGKLLEAYPQLPIERGDTLRIERNETFLPVHRLWILTFGLVGRYGSRSEDSIVMGSARLLDVAPGIVTEGNHPGHQHTLGGPPIMQPASESREPLRGITGTIVPSRNRPVSTYTFIPHDIPYLESIKPDKLSLRSLFWLALGAIPFGEGRVYSIVDPEPPKTWSYQDESGKGTQTNANGDIAMASFSRQTLVDSERQTTLSSRVRFCKLVQIDTANGPPFDILRRFGGGKQTLHGLEEVPLDPSDPYKPPSSISWVILPSTSPTTTDNTVWKLQRKDAQLLARRLLELEWHPEGYLFGRHRAPRLWRFFTAAASDLHSLLERMQTNIHFIANTERDRDKLTEVLEPAIRASNRQEINRAGTRALYAALDVIIKLGRSPEEQIISDLVSVLFITDAEFRNLVMQSCKHLSPATTATTTAPSISSSLTLVATTPSPAQHVSFDKVITFSRPVSCILVPGAFGVPQSFHVDLEGLYHANGATQRFFREGAGRENIHAGLRIVILAALRAGCVSALLRGAWSSEALFKFLGDYPEGVMFS
ncbi:hypothetical protein DIS24_g11869 [Lasiodiplodia hormozganensis]|uniref:Uncharacterized protein n=1 Tax=Lasiodiplodia hormozganensis TaxID=869390 RepID=A0AA40BVM3_9PEZI|nr:hypothetical protein DIS24_g11869 [Lasiodiplodia hormozganensis]